MGLDRGRPSAGHAGQDLPRLARQAQGDAVPVGREQRASGQMPAVDGCEEHKSVRGAGPRRDRSSSSVVIDMLTLLLGLPRASLRSRGDLAVENVLLRHQLAVAVRARPRPTIRGRDKLLWILARRFVRDWRRHLVVVRPATVVAWHRRGWRLFWWWRSRCPLGRPRLSPEVRELIATRSRDNPRWGAERIRGELLKLGIVVSKRSVRR
jgi:hypothetical protein